MVDGGSGERKLQVMNSKHISSKGHYSVHNPLARQTSITLSAHISF